MALGAVKGMEGAGRATIRNVVANDEQASDGGMLQNREING